MSSKPDIPSIAFGVSITLIFLFVLIIIIDGWFPTSTTFYQDGYYTAYKQFRQETLEQSAPRNIRLRFEIEMLKEKFK